MKTYKLMIMVCVTLAFGLVAQATPVTPEQALCAAGNWIRGGRSLDRRLGREAESATAVSAANGASFHVVKVKGGGFLVMSADTTIEPVIAFSSSGELRNDPRSPLWVLLTGDLAARARAVSSCKLYAAASSGKRIAKSGPESRWAALLAEEGDAPGPARLYAAAGRAVLSDVRVDALLETAWAQGDYRNYGREGESEYCYNYFTPNHWPCGCVATAGAQIMRYHRYPDTEVTPQTYSCATGVLTEVVGGIEYYSGVSCSLTMQGGLYDWAAMTPVPAEGCSAASRRAIGKLTSDVGIACGMEYYPFGGEASVNKLIKRFLDRFKYANAVGVTFQRNFYPQDFSYTLERFKAAVIPNFDAGLPVALGLSSAYDQSGHAVVGDGYGYSDGNFYVHVNLGWANLNGGDAWYMPPDIDDYDTINTVVYNVYPRGPAGGSLISGRVLSSSGEAVAGATVTATGREGTTVSATSDARGLYALKVQPGTYDLVAVFEGTRGERASVLANECVSTAYDEDGHYWSRPVPQIGNVYGQDITVARQDAVYTIRFLGGDGTGTMNDQACMAGKVCNLDTCEFKNDGKTFKGWACSNGRRYDDGMLIFDLAQPGEKVTMTAIWE